MTVATIAATDGSSLGNPGPAGWAWVCADGRQGWASARHSTNNRMELRAVLELLRCIPDPRLVVQADSQYVINVFTSWLPGWRRRGMRTSGGKQVENQDLILRIDELLTGREVHWEWVRGHQGHPLNERADSLARYAAERAQRVADGRSLDELGEEPPRIRCNGTVES